MNIKECEDRIDVFDDELEEMSLESLQQLLILVNECDECDGCGAQKNLLHQLIAEKEKGLFRR